MSVMYDWNYYTPGSGDETAAPGMGWTPGSSEAAQPRGTSEVARNRPAQTTAAPTVKNPGWFRKWLRQNNMTPGTTAYSAMDAQRDSVFGWVQGQFQSWGMGDLGADVVSILKDARSPEQAVAQIRKTDAYARRFAGNLARVDAGFGMLSEADYIHLESSYRQAMHAAGLPKGFYDSPDDFAGYIGKDVSPAEIQRRAEIAGDLAVNHDPHLWRALQERGISKGGAAAYMLNPEKALPMLERQVAAAEIGGEADRAGMGFKKGTGFENKLADAGVSKEQARAAFAEVNSEAPDVNRLARIEGGERYGDKKLVKAELGLDDGRTKRKVRGMASRERARWGGSSGGTSAFGDSTDF